MALIRPLLIARGVAIAALLLLALAMKALMPAGMMFAVQDRHITVVVCADGLGEHRTVDLVVPIDQAPAGKKSTGTDDTPCPYAGLGMAGLPGANAILLAGALGYILVRSIPASPAPRLEPVRQLRPPLRGPPVLS
jgi:hypothetical protein